MDAHMVPEQFVVVAGDIDYLGSFFGFTEDFSQYVIMRLGPKYTFFHAPDINDVAHQIKVIGFGVFEKIEEVVGFAAFEAKVHVGNPNGPEV
jgi:hypothetical protein